MNSLFTNIASRSANMMGQSSAFLIAIRDALEREAGSGDTSAASADENVDELLERRQL